VHRVVVVRERLNDLAFLPGEARDGAALERVRDLRVLLAGHEPRDRLRPVADRVLPGRRDSASPAHRVPDVQEVVLADTGGPDARGDMADEAAGEGGGREASRLLTGLRETQAPRDLGGRAARGLPAREPDLDALVRLALEDLLRGGAASAVRGLLAQAALERRPGRLARLGLRCLAADAADTEREVGGGVEGDVEPEPAEARRELAVDARLFEYVAEQALVVQLEALAAGVRGAAEGCAAARLDVVDDLPGGCGLPVDGAGELLEQCERGRETRGALLLRGEAVASELYGRIDGLAALAGQDGEATSLVRGSQRLDPLRADDSRRELRVVLALRGGPFTVGLVGRHGPWGGGVRASRSAWSGVAVRSR
jgi:hypothetical protein